MATVSQTFSTPQIAQGKQDAAAALGLDLNLFNQFSLNPNAFQQKYGQFRDPTTGVFAIEGVTPGALMQNPNYAGGTINPDGTPIRAGTPMTGGTASGGGFTGLPNYGVVGVDQLFDPNFGRTETQTRAAENALMGGFSGSGYAAGQGARLLDSERRTNLLAGHQILEPYLNREFQGGQAAADRAARLNEIAAQGASALQQLQLSEAGSSARLSTSQRGELERQILSGQQAMQQLTLREAGDMSRQRTQVGGTLANTLLQGVLSGKGVGTGESTRAPFNVGATFGTPSNLNQFNAPVAYNPVARGVSGSGGVNSLLGGSSIDQLLRKYGLL